MSDIKIISEWLGSGSINVFGMPFAGKDTQGKHLASDLGAIRLGGGEILRNSVIPPHVKTTIDAGGLAPTKEYIEIVLPYLTKKEFTGKPLVLSSVGRWQGEEQGVMQVAQKSGHPIMAVIHLDIDEATVRERWRSAIHLGDRDVRADDAEHLLDIRLEEYYKKTLPVLEAYKKLGLLDIISGMGTQQETYQQILDKLLARASA